MKWEYRKITFSKKESISVNVMNWAGQDGWEMVGFIKGEEYELIFKRPIIEKVSKRGFLDWLSFLKKKKQ